MSSPIVIGNFSTLRFIVMHKLPLLCLRRRLLLRKLESCRRVDSLVFVGTSLALPLVRHFCSADWSEIVGAVRAHGTDLTSQYPGECPRPQQSLCRTIPPTRVARALPEPS